MRSSCVLLALLVGGCGLLSFDVGQDIVEQRVPGNPLGGVLPAALIPGFPLMIDLRAETAKRDTGPATAALLKSVVLRATPADAPSGNFDFLTEVRIYVRSPSKPDLPEVEVATLQPVPRGQTRVEFAIVPGVDLLPYINAGAELTARAQGTQPARDFTYDGRVEVTVKL